eukprot:2784568-Pyramimonas_sp.AAC.1
MRQQRLARLVASPKDPLRPLTKGHSCPRSLLRVAECGKIRCIGCIGSSSRRLQNRGGCGSIGIYR